MSTAVVKPQGVPRQVNRKRERFFFSGMAVLLLATVLAGFWPTYYGAGLINAPLPNAVVHVHGALFSLWMILFLVQVGLISAKKVKVHRTLGLAGFVLAVLMVVAGVLTGTLQLRRNLNVSGPATRVGANLEVSGNDAQYGYLTPVTNMLVFGTLIFFAYRLRRQSDAHKRLALLATIALMGAPIFRIPVPLFYHRVLPEELALVGFVLLVAAYDLFSLHRVHRVTLWASAFGIFVHVVRIPVGHSATWHWVANHIVAIG
jgi:phosphatidylserine synthase